MAQSNLSFSLSRMVASTLRYWWRVSLSVALGVAVATAVIVGALLVGDSMRGSLRQLTIERLGNTEVVIFPGGFGTIDELFEALTLIQTAKLAEFPVILADREYWSPLIDWLRDTMLKRKCISESDLQRFQILDTPYEIADVLDRCIDGHHS